MTSVPGIRDLLFMVDSNVTTQKKYENNAENHVERGKRVCNPNTRITSKRSGLLKMLKR